jgi:hypothetical protein
MADERVWLRHGETGGHFHCPSEAVEDWQGLGWEPVDTPPDEPNPVVAELVAWQAEQAAALEAADTKSKGRKSGSETISQEG